MRVKFLQILVFFPGSIPSPFFSLIFRPTLLKGSIFGVLKKPEIFIIFKNRFFSGSTPEKKSQNEFFDRKWSKILTCAETCKTPPKIDHFFFEGHFRYNRYFDGFWTNFGTIFVCFLWFILHVFL